MDGALIQGKNLKAWWRRASRDREFPALIRQDTNIYRDRIWRHEGGKTNRPLDEHDTIAAPDDLLESKT